MTRKIIRLSLKTIFHNKMRSFLTVLGIIIGVMAVVILVSITQGAAAGITDSISDMGSQQITATITDEDVSVSAADVEELHTYSAVSGVAAVNTFSETVKKKEETGTYSIVGITPEYFEVQDLAVQRGRKIAPSDDECCTRVCVLGTEAATDLFGTWDAVGGTVRIGDRTFQVVGVLEEQGSSLAGSDDSRILIPYSTAERMTGQTGVSTFYVRASSEQEVEAAVSIVDAFLLQATRDEDAYTVNNQSDILDTMDDVSGTMSLLLGGIAAISLVVGGIGIMNIMLVSVTERTMEIGIRKAVGAKRRHILLQFLCESCVLSVLGGAAGLVLSFVCIRIYDLLTGSESTVNLAVALASILFCAGIGVVFGSYPAAKASRLQPIDALRRS